jgi:hypothetical protein
VRDERDQVGQGLARAGAGLDQQVITGFDRPGHLPRHFVLAAAALSAHAGHGAVEEFDHEILTRRGSGMVHRRVSHC